MGVRIREKKPGEWWIFVTHNGKRISRRVGKRAAAEKAAEQIQAKLTLGVFKIEDPEKKIPTFRQYASDWLETIIKPTRKLSTYQRYKTILEKQVYPVIGNHSLDAIKRSDIKSLLVGEYSKGYSRSSVCLIRDVLSGPMLHALDEELITVNPVAGVLKTLQLERTKRLKVDPLTPDEVALFLDTCKTSAPEWHPFFVCAFRTGMRLGELLALEWGDIDWHGMFIQVRRSYKLGQVSTTKTGRERRVDMSDYLALTLKTLLTQAKKDDLRHGRETPLPFVFHRHGERFEQNYIRRVFKRLLGKAGLREVRFHDIRHTFASLLLSMGESAVYVKEQLGHSSIQITVDIYGHLIPSSNRAAVNKLDNLHPSAPPLRPAENERP